MDNGVTFAMFNWTLFTSRRRSSGRLCRTAMWRAALLVACAASTVWCDARCPGVGGSGGTSGSTSGGCVCTTDRYAERCSTVTCHGGLVHDTHVNATWPSVEGGGSWSHLKELTISHCVVKHLNVTFEGLNILQLLDLSHNGIANIDDGVLASLPSLSSLSLRGNYLSDLTGSWLKPLSQLEALDLSSNNISTLQSSPFLTLHLVTLNLSRNHIITLTESSLKGLESLQSLDLSANVICVLDNYIFRKLSSLQWLNLSGNRLEMLSEEYFSGLAHLQMLDVSTNRISVITSGSFESLSGLTELVVAGNPLGPLQKELLVLVGTGRRLQTVDASSCNLTDIPAALTWSIRDLKLSVNMLATVRRGDLDSYPLLQTLDLSSNHIIGVEDDALGRLELLTALHLSANRLQVIPNSLPSSLHALYLGGNNIEYISVGDLQGMPRLKVVILRQSNIKAIQDGAFSSLQQLHVLDLSDNPLRLLPPSVLAGPQQLHNLQLSHLPDIVADDTRELAFPVASPERLEILELNGSPVLVKELFGDSAALAAFRELRQLNLEETNLTSLRSDLFHFMPRLEVLRLAHNPWACGDMLWLTKWMQKEKREERAYGDVRCTSPPQLAWKLIVDLQNSDFNITDNATSTPATTQASTTEEPVLASVLDTRLGNLQNRQAQSISVSPDTHADGTYFNTTPTGKNISEEESLKNQFLNESEAKLKFPVMPRASKLNSFVETTNVDSSFTNITYHGFLSTVSGPDEKGLKNVRHISQVFNDAPTEESAFNLSSRNDYKTINKTEGPKVANNEAIHNASSVVVKLGSLVTHKEGGKNGNIENMNNVESVFRAGDQDRKSDTSSSPASVQHNSSSTATATVPRNKKRQQASLRSASKMSSRHNSSDDLLLVNKSRGDPVFDKMMRDRFGKNRLQRLNDNYSRVKSSSHNSHAYITKPNNTSSTDVYPLTDKNTDLSSPGSQISQPSSTPTLQPRSGLGATSKPKYAVNSYLSHMKSSQIDRNRVKPDEKNIYTDESANSSAIWGTIKSISDLKLSSVKNVSELLIGIVRHTSRDVEPKLKRVLDRSSSLFNEVSRHGDHVISQKNLYIGPHPSMFVLLALCIAGVVVLGFGLWHCRRRRRRRAVEYSRQHDIEVRSMSCSTVQGEQERW